MVLNHLEVDVVFAGAGGVDDGRFALAVQHGRRRGICPHVVFVEMQRHARLSPFRTSKGYPPNGKWRTPYAKNRYLPNGKWRIPFVFMKILPAAPEPADSTSLLCLPQYSIMIPVNLQEGRKDSFLQILP